MSSFVVSDKTINLIVAAVLDDDQRKTLHGEVARLFEGTTDLDARGAAALGQQLHDLNIRAVLSRYPDMAAAHSLPQDWVCCAEEHKLPAEWTSYTYQQIAPTTKLGTFKAMHCLEYQCAEDGMVDEGLYQALRAAMLELALQIVTDSKAYEQLPWDY